jgi:two-component system, OmpR family, sensor histidine kinase VicK
MSHSAYRTDIVRGSEDVMNITLKFLSSAKSRIDICTKVVFPKLSDPIGMFVQPFLDAGKRGVRLRLIGNFAKEDAAILQSFSAAVELRHLDTITTYFGVSDNEYVAIPGTGEFSPQGPLLYSNEESLVKHHQALFEMLWETAVPAQSRINDLEQGRVRSETRIVRGEEDVVRLIGSFLSRATAGKPNPYAYGVSDKDSTVRAAEGYYESARRLLTEHPNFKILHITDIQRENLESVKKLVQAGYEVRHIDGNKIRFSVSKDEYIETTRSKMPGGIPDEIVWSNDPQLVAQGTRVFDALWNHALPSDVRIRDLEEGVSRETMKIIRNPAESQKLFLELVAAAKYEILLLLPTSNAFHRDEKIGLMDLLMTAGNEGVRVSILSPVDESIEQGYPNFILRPDKEQGARTDEGRAISLRRISQARTQNAVTILVVDGSSTLIMEERNASSVRFVDALGFVTYSTTSPTVRSSIRFFERLREEADLREREQVTLERERNSRRQAELLQDILSHDIRNYNQIAKSSAEMLKMDMDGNVKAQKDAESLIEAIIRAADGSTELIDSAKKLAKAISSQEILLRPTDMGASLERAISLVTKAYHDKVITLSLSVPEGASVLADELLDEVFTNVLSNAVKYTQGRDVSVAIHVEEEKDSAQFRHPQLKSATPSQRYWRIEITDQGRGIPDEMKENVFKRYATVSSGSGLGLSIVHALVTGRYEGEVRMANRVENDYSRGTTVKLWLPGAI